MSRPRAAALCAFLLAGALLAGEELHCDRCSKTISGRYAKVKAEGKERLLCAACVEQIRKELEATAPPCALCGKRISGPHTRVTRGTGSSAVCKPCLDASTPCSRCRFPVLQGGLCPACEKEAPRCSLCKGVITGEFSRFPEGDQYCPTCRKEKPACERCRRPLGEEYVVKGDLTLCRRCELQVPVCGACRKGILGTRHLHPFTEGEYCKDCEEKLPKCSACGRPVPESDAAQVGRIRLACPECLPSIIPDFERVQAIWDEVRQIILAKLDEAIAHEVALHLTPDIGEVRRAAGFESDGRELGLFRRTGEQYEIHVLDGLTEALAYETIAHEWGHAWFAEQGHPDHALEFEEGFCQWVASVVLEEKGFERSLRILASRIDLYGEGYRRAEAIETQSGSAGLLRFVRRPPPPGAPRRERK